MTAHHVLAVLGHGTLLLVKAGCALAIIVLGGLFAIAGSTQRAYDAARHERERVHD